MEAEERSEESQRDLAQKWQDAIRVKPESQRRWDVIKVVLRSLSLVCAVALILSFVALYKNHGFVFPVDVWTASLGSLVPVSSSYFLFFFSGTPCSPYCAEGCGVVLCWPAVMSQQCAATRRHRLKASEPKADMSEIVGRAPPSYPGHWRNLSQFASGVANRACA